MSTLPPENPDPSGSRRTRRIFLRIFLPALAGIVLLLYLLVEFRGRRSLAPRPPARGALPSVPELPPSRVGLHVLYGMDEAFRAAEDRIPLRFGSLEDRRVHPRNPRVSYAVQVDRNPLDVTLSRDSVFVSTTLEYQGRIWFDAPFGGELTTTCAGEGSNGRPRALLRLSSPIDFAEGWRIRPEFQVEEVVPASDALRDRCQVSVGPLRLDATDPLLTTARAQLQEELTKLGSALGQLDLEAAIASRWAQLGHPVRLRDSVWLQLDADSIVVEGLEPRGPDGRILSARVALVGHPRVVVGSRPSPLDGPPPLVPGSVEEDFVALLETRIEHGAASRMATDALRGRNFEIAGRSLRIEEVHVFGADGGRVALEVEVDGILAGRLYLVGTPELDPSTGQITVPDLGFSVQTRNLLVRGAAWLLRGTFVERVRSYARWDVGPSIERARSLSSMELDRRVSETLFVRGALGSVELLGVHVGRDAMLVHARVEGTLGILVGGDSLRIGSAGPPGNPERSGNEG